jgi:hypothetical protein
MFRAYQYFLHPEKCDSGGGMTAVPRAFLQTIQAIHNEHVPNFQQRIKTTSSRCMKCM